METTPAYVQAPTPGRQTTGIEAIFDSPAASYHGNVSVSPYDTINLSDIEPPDLGIESMFDKVKGMDTIKALLNDDDLYAAKVASIKEAAQQSSMSDDEMHAALLEAENNAVSLITRRP